MAEKLKAAIFDWDGTIADSAELQVSAEKATAVKMAEDLGTPFNEHMPDWSRFQGWARVKIAKRLFGADDELADLYREQVADTTVRLINDRTLKPISGAIGFAEFLKIRGLQLGLATSSNSTIIRPSIDLFGMQNEFRYTVCNREALDDKPLPGPYRYIMNRMDVKRSKTLVIEDSCSGIEAGIAAGALVMAIATTESMDYLRSNTRAHLVAEDYKHAAYLVDVHTS